MHASPVHWHRRRHASPLSLTLGKLAIFTARYQWHRWCMTSVSTTPVTCIVGVIDTGKYMLRWCQWHRWVIFCRCRLHRRSTGKVEYLREYSKKSKLFLGLFTGTRRSCLKKKTGGEKSGGTVPIKCAYCLRLYSSSLVLETGSWRLRGRASAHCTHLWSVKLVQQLTQPQSTQSDGPVCFLIFCSLSISLLTSLVAGWRPQCSAGAE
jgi:hypothetical protein